MTKRAVVVGINDYSNQPSAKHFSWPRLRDMLGPSAAGTPQRGRLR
jgi:hypothetical protein